MISTNYSYERATADDHQRRTQGRPGFVAGVVSQFFEDKSKERLEAERNPWAVERGFK
jgi:hypothetical protein